MFFGTRVRKVYNPGKVNVEGLVHLLIYIRATKNLGLKYYPRIEYAPLFNILRKYRINYENQLMVLSD